MFEIATPWKRIKHCPNLKGEKKKKKGCPISKKPRMSDLRYGIDLRPMIFRLSTLQRPGNPCPISKKVGKKGKNLMFGLEKPKRSDLRSKGKMDIIPRCADARRLGDWDAENFV